MIKMEKRERVTRESFLRQPEWWQDGRVRWYLTPLLNSLALWSVCCCLCMHTVAGKTDIVYIYGEISAGPWSPHSFLFPEPGPAILRFITFNNGLPIYFGCLFGKVPIVALRWKQRVKWGFLRSKHLTTHMRW